MPHVEGATVLYAGVEKYYAVGTGNPNKGLGNCVLRVFPFTSVKMYTAGNYTGDVSVYEYSPNTYDIIHYLCVSFMVVKNTPSDATIKNCCMGGTDEQCIAYPRGSYQCDAFMTDVWCKKPGVGAECACINAVVGKDAQYLNPKCFVRDCVAGNGYATNNMNQACPNVISCVQYNNIKSMPGIAIASGIGVEQNCGNGTTKKPDAPPPIDDDEDDELSEMQIFVVVVVLILSCVCIYVGVLYWSPVATSGATAVAGAFAPVQTRKHTFKYP